MAKSRLKNASQMMSLCASLFLFFMSGHNAMRSKGLPFLVYLEA